MCVCMYVYMYVHRCVYVWVYVCVCDCMRVHLGMCAGGFLHACALLNTNARVLTLRFKFTPSITGVEGGRRWVEKGGWGRVMVK